MILPHSVSHPNDERARQENDVKAKGIPPLLAIPQPSIYSFDLGDDPTYRGLNTKEHSDLGELIHSVGECLLGGRKDDTRSLIRVAKVKNQSKRTTKYV